MSMYMDSFFSKLVLSNETHYRLGRHILFWMVWWVFLGFIYGFYYSEGKTYEMFSISYIESLVFMPQHIFLSYAIIYYILPSYIFKEKYWIGFLLVLLLILMTAALSPLINFNVIRPLRESLHYSVKKVTFFYSFMGGLRGSMTVAGFAVAVKLVKHWYQNKIENEQLEKERLRAELEVLKGQIHPHFMFNTLNSIYSMALKKSDATPEAILKLSQLMRYILTECTKVTVALNKEVEILLHYIELEKSRFGERLDISVNIKGDLDSNTIAPLLLLPFVENSFKHGANEMIEQAWISLDLQVNESTLKFKLINGRSIDNNNPNSIHVGLQNAKKRLQLLYPNAYDLRITEDAETFVVSLVISLDSIKLIEA
ncbi:Histidine kinase [Ohtaekwangia koreensis]|uniref:Histidine kinase n=2 Tax=Ohtaekwangia koreensis TaxID=688867 RepID=A0A1T5L7J5_9BACT|nr:Histidine kinase [Ohtaekwangia koreensis]